MYVNARENISAILVRGSVNYLFVFHHLHTVIALVNAALKRSSSWGHLLGFTGGDYKCKYGISDYNVTGVQRVQYVASDLNTQLPFWRF